MPPAPTASPRWRACAAGALRGREPAGRWALMPPALIVRWRRHCRRMPTLTSPHSPPRSIGGRAAQSQRRESVCDAHGRALYSRAPIPWNRDGAPQRRQPARFRRRQAPHRPVRLPRGRLLHWRNCPPCWRGRETERLRVLGHGLLMRVADAAERGPDVPRSQIWNVWRRS
jgi:hypothetical protein